jgi:cell division protein ZapA
MSQVRIKVGPKTYSIACGPGEEEKVAKLGALIDKHYARLGSARAALEADNVVFAALFMADELAEAQSVASDARAELSEVKQELQRAQDDAANAAKKAATDSETDKERSGSKKAELRAEIETLRKAEERARKDVASLKAQLAVWEERARHQHDLFGGPAEDAALSNALAEKLEALAIRAESTASELEGRSRSH